MRDFILAWLVWLSADPAAVDVERPKAAAAVAAARASMAVEATPVPPAPPAPQQCVCGATCVNGIWKPDGRITQPCPCKCSRCITKPGCPDGKCRVPGASPATFSPAKP